MKQHSRFKTAKKVLIFWCLFIGIGAVAGAVGMLTAPDGSNLGMQPMLPYFQVLPFADVLFKDYLFAGISLLCVNGITNLVASGLMLAGKKSGIICGTVFGFTLMAWITIQFVILPMNFLSTIYFIFGILQAAAGFAALIFLKQESFTVNEIDYKNIGTNPDRLVIFFSRMGYTKKAAYEAADRTGAFLYEVKSTEPTEGTKGFWWCGRFGMHRWDMPIKEISIDLSSYKHVTICTPVWVFHLAAPMRSFLRASKGKIKETDYIIVHFERCGFNSVVREMNCLLGISAENAESLCCRQGRIINKISIESSVTSEMK